jgi:hypothetical protein
MSMDMYWGGGLVATVCVKDWSSELSTKSESLPAMKTDMLIPQETPKGTLLPKPVKSLV